MSQDQENTTPEAEEGILEDFTNKDEAQVSEIMDTPDIRTPEEEIELLKAKVAEAEDKALRIQAEMMNFRRRQEKDRNTWHGQSVKEVVLSFLDPFDNLQRAIESADKSRAQDPDKSSEQLLALIEGVSMVNQQLQEVLKSKKVDVVDPLGEKFDTNFHEAMGQLQTNEYPEGHVAAVFRKGYRMQETCIRTAMIQVATPIVESEESQSE